MAKIPAIMAGKPSLENTDSLSEIFKNMTEQEINRKEMWVLQSSNGSKTNSSNRRKSQEKWVNHIGSGDPPKATKILKTISGSSKKHTAASLCSVKSKSRK